MPPPTSPASPAAVQARVLNPRRRVRQRAARGQRPAGAPGRRPGTGPRDRQPRTGRTGGQAGTGVRRAPRRRGHGRRGHARGSGHRHHHRRAGGDLGRRTRPGGAGHHGAPPAAVTLIDALEWHATRTPDRIHIHLREDDGEETPITYGALWAAAVAVANGLAARRVGQRETVAIMLRTERAFFPTFLGTLLAGCIPVPLYPPVRANRIEEYAERQVGILRNAGARLLLITFAEIRTAGGRAGAAGALAVGRRHARLALRGRRRRGDPLRPGRARQRRAGPHPVHLGQHGQPQGRAALPREPARQHPGDRARSRRAARRPWG